jgi:nucleotide-binding universal stress UspA family protein
MKIVLAVDNSPASQTVLDSAVNRIWPAQAKFRVLNIVNVQRFERLPALIEDATRESQWLVDKAAEKMRGAGLDVVSRSSPGHPRSDISCFAKEWDADLILVGSHGHGAIARFLLGSVAQGVLRTAPCSVEIVRPAPAISRNRSLKVLLATDGSDCSVAAAHNLAVQPWPPGSRFKVLSVEELVTAGNQMEASSLSAVYPATLLERLVTDARNRANSAAETGKDILTRAGLELEVGEKTALGEPRGVILDAAKEWGADLIVLGSHGRRGFDRLLLGSVSEAVAIHAPCSVRVVRTKRPAKESSHAQ